MSFNIDHIKPVVDGVSVVTLVSTIAGWLPAVAAIFTIVWTAIRIWETNTVQNWIKKKL